MINYDRTLKSIAHCWSPDGETRRCQWRTRKIFRFLGIFQIFGNFLDWKALRIVDHLMVKLAIANGELGPEEKRKLFVHHRLRSLLLRPLDLLQRHVAKAHGKLTSGLNKEQCSLKIHTEYWEKLNIFMLVNFKIDLMGYWPGDIPLFACYWQCRQSWSGEREMVSLPKIASMDVHYQQSGHHQILD